MKKQQYITPQMECFQMNSEGLLANSGDKSSLSIDRDQTIDDPSAILSPSKGDTSMEWE